MFKKRSIAAIVIVMGGAVTSAMCQTSTSGASAVDRETLKGKLVVGYQGWFACPADSVEHGTWRHWFSQDHVTVDILPDVTELNKDELCPTSIVDRDGKPVYFYSAQNPTTVDRHFTWMQQYGIQTVALQRFAQELLSPSRKVELDTVLKNVRDGAEKHSRSFYLEYDLTGVRDEEGSMQSLRIGQPKRRQVFLRALLTSDMRAEPCWKCSVSVFTVDICQPGWRRNSLIGCGKLVSLMGA